MHLFKLVLLRALLVLSLITPSYAAPPWVSSKDGIAANFPTPPTRVGASTAQSTGFAYQSHVNYANGGALFAITINPAPPAVLAQRQTEFIQAVHDQSAQSLGQDPKRSSNSWRKFGTDRRAYNYKLEGNVDGTPIKTRGFWIADKDRVIRVSVLYTSSLSRDQERDTLAFLDTFTLLSDASR